MKKMVVFLMLMFGLGLITNSTLAFRLTPASLDIEVKRGESQTQVLKIGNSSENPISCRVYVIGFEVLKDGKQLFEGANKKFSAVGWISFRKRFLGLKIPWKKYKDLEFEVSPEGIEEAEIEIGVPKNAQPGDYYATIMAESTVPGRAKTPQGVEVSVNLRLGCITRITIPGRTIRKKAEISEVRVELPKPETEEPVKIIATLENKCEVHLDGRGEVLIKNTEGRVFDRFVLQGAGKEAKGQALVYPEGSRDFWGVVERPLPPGEYVAEAVFDYGYQFRRLREKTFFVVSPEMGQKQREFLTMTVEPNLLELEMSSGAFRTQSLKVSNLDFEPLKVEVLTSSSWLGVKPSQLIIRPNNYITLRIEVAVPTEEPVARNGKIILKPEKGKAITIDVVISEYKREEKKEVEE